MRNSYVLENVRAQTANVKSRLKGLSMSESDIAVILNRLDQLEETLKEVHREVKRTNGRVTDLEMEEARWQGEQRGRHMQRIVMSSVLSGAILAGIVWGLSYLAK